MNPFLVAVLVGIDEDEVSLLASVAGNLVHELCLMVAGEPYGHETTLQVWLRLDHKPELLVLGLFIWVVFRIKRVLSIGDEDHDHFFRVWK